jgi:hypothetical protein
MSQPSPEGPSCRSFRVERHPIEITEKAFDRFLQGPILKLGSHCSAQLAIRLDYNPRLALELH